MQNNLENLRSLSLANQLRFKSEGNMQELYFWNGFNNAICARIGDDPMINADERRAFYLSTVEMAGRRLAVEVARLRGFEAGMIS
jgi:hypothetical protein